MATPEKLNAAPQSQPAEEAPRPPKAQKEKAQEEGVVRWYRVTETAEQPRKHGGGSYVLPRGKVISSKGYDVDELLAMGVKMEPCEEPGWHKKVQAAGRSR